MKTLSHIWEMLSGISIGKVHNRQSGLRVIRAGDITGGNKIEPGEVLYTDPPQRFDRELRKGDLLFVKTGSKNGDCAMFDGGERPVANQSVLILRPAGGPEAFLDVVKAHRSEIEALAGGEIIRTLWAKALKEMVVG